MAECSVCIEKFNKTTRRLIKCKGCDFEICLTCTKTIFKNSEKSSPCCTSCTKPFDDDFIAENFPKSYVNGELRKIQENVLFEEMKQLLPATQPLAKYALVIKSNVEQMNTNKLKMDELYQQIERLKVDNHGYHRQMSEFYSTYELPDTNTVNNVNKESKLNTYWTKPCPVNDCKGYFSSEWKCGMCEVKVCKECNEPKYENHECNPNDVAAMKEIRETTKSCPGCGTYINKMFGCNQMWCTYCKVAFDWTTRRIVTKGIHNPHYYEWQRKNTNGNIQREIGDVICGGIPDAYMLSQFINKLTIGDNPEKEALAKSHIYLFHRFLSHVHHVELPRLNNTIDNNTDILINFLNNDLSEQKLKQTGITRRKRNLNKKNKQDIFLTLRDAGNDIIQNFINGNVPLFETDTTINELITYINKSFAILSRKFSCTTSYIFKQKTKKYRHHETNEYAIEPMKY